MICSTVKRFHGIALLPFFKVPKPSLLTQRTEPVKGARSHMRAIDTRYIYCGADQTSNAA